MATRWYYRACGQDLGPVSFHQLARLVREGSVTEEDAVRAEWENEWHCAAGVVGLFHTAHRLSCESHDPGFGITGRQPDNVTGDTPASVVDADVPRPGAEPALHPADAAVEDLETLLEGAEPIGSQPSWVRRLIEVASG